VTGIALNYLGLDANTTSADDLAQAEATADSDCKPFIRYFDSASLYIDDLAIGRDLRVDGLFGRHLHRRRRAAAADQASRVKYVIPREGAADRCSTSWPSRRMRRTRRQRARSSSTTSCAPQVVAAISNYVFFASANEAATELVDEEVKQQSGHLPERGSRIAEGLRRSRRIAQRRSIGLDALVDPHQDRSA
jgi:putrescine transport system substrate-binding protein